MTKHDIEVMTSSASVEWATPQDFFEKYEARYHFTLDAAANADNAKAARYFTEAEDGLAQDWGGHGSRVWCNPPYGRTSTRAWVRKASEEAKKALWLSCCCRLGQNRPGFMSTFYRMRASNGCAGA